MRSKPKPRSRGNVDAHVENQVEKVTVTEKFLSKTVFAPEEYALVKCFEKGLFNIL